MMIVRSMRWGCDNGGISFGMAEGNTIVELVVTKERRTYFIDLIRMMKFEHIFISEMPLYDLLVESSRVDVDFDAEFNKVTESSGEEYSYRISDEPEEMGESAFVKAIHLVRLAMQEHYGNVNPQTDWQTAQDFLRPYVNRDLDEIDLPLLK